MTIVNQDAGDLQIVRFDDDLALESGRVLPGFELACESYGRLDASRGNAILVCHNLTADAHAAGPGPAGDPRPGWWDAAIGPGKPFDTTRYCVICSSVIGGATGSSGPASMDPATGRPYGMRFPVVTIADMVAAQVRLADRMGIERFHAIAGGCMGGFQVLQWLAQFPERTKRAIAIGATPRTSAHNLALWEVVRQAIMRDPCWRGGDYYGLEPPFAGVNLATMIGMLIWMSRDVMQTRFGLRLANGDDAAKPAYTMEPEFAMQAFLRDIGVRRNLRIDPNALLYLTRATDYFDLTRGRRDLAEVFASVRASTLLVSYREDWRYPPAEVDEIARALERVGAAVEHRVLDSAFGHGAFIYDAQGVGELIRTFLAEPAGVNS